MLYSSAGGATLFGKSSHCTNVLYKGLGDPGGGCSGRSGPVKFHTQLAGLHSLSLEGCGCDWTADSLNASDVGMQGQSSKASSEGNARFNQQRLGHSVLLRLGQLIQWVFNYEYLLLAKPNHRPKCKAKKGCAHVSPCI